MRRPTKYHLKWNPILATQEGTVTQNFDVSAPPRGLKGDLGQRYLVMNCSTRCPAIICACWSVRLFIIIVFLFLSRRFQYCNLHNLTMRVCLLLVHVSLCHCLQTWNNKEKLSPTTHTHTRNKLHFELTATIGIQTAHSTSAQLGTVLCLKGSLMLVSSQKNPRLSATSPFFSAR